MIIAFVGNVGSGKSLSSVRFMHSRQQQTFCNFDVKLPNMIRLQKSHIIKENIKDTLKSGKEVKEKKVNWEFWNEFVKDNNGFDIVIDELHNMAHSRMAMSKNNVLFTMWFSQIRKLLGTNEKNHIILISQKLSRIDVAFRDLIDTVVFCQKVQLPYLVETEVRQNGRIVKKMLPVTLIVQYTFKGEFCVDNYYLFRDSPKMAKQGRLYKKDFFMANEYFKYYDSYEIINFGDDAYL